MSDVTLTLRFATLAERDQFIRTHVEQPWCLPLGRQRVRADIPDDYRPLDPAVLAHGASL